MYEHAISLFAALTYALAIFRSSGNISARVAPCYDLFEFQPPRALRTDELECIWPGEIPSSMSCIDSRYLPAHVFTLGP